MREIYLKAAAVGLLAGIPLGVSGHFGASLIEFNYNAAPETVEVLGLMELDDTNDMVSVEECTASLFNTCYAVVAIGENDADIVKIGGRTALSNPSDTLYEGRQYDGLYYDADQGFSKMGSLKMRPGVCKATGFKPEGIMI